MLLLLEQLVDLSLVRVENLIAFGFEGLFDVNQVGLIGGAQLFVLFLHAVNEGVDVVSHVGHGLDVLLVLALELLQELVDQLLLVVDDLLALILLHFDFLTNVTTYEVQMLLTLASS